MITVDVARLQTELRALHQRIEMLEVAAVVAAEEREKEEDLDGGSGSSAFGGAAAAAVATEVSAHPDELDGGSVADDLTAGTHGEPRRYVYAFVYRQCRKTTGIGSDQPAVTVCPSFTAARITITDLHAGLVFASHALRG